MTLVDRYIKLKEKYPDYIIFIKSGNFYNTYFDDAILISCLCNYKIVNNKICFPCSNLNKVKYYLCNRLALIVSNGFINVL